MSGTFTSKSLAAGYIGNTLITLYQAPTSPAKTGYLKSFSITSNNANSVQVSLYKNISGNQYPWITFVLNNFGEHADIVDGDYASISLSSGDLIQAQTNVTISNTISYGIHGVEEQ